MKHRKALYADDKFVLLQFETNLLLPTIPTLLNPMSTIGIFSGYRLNNDKSLILFIDAKERLSPPIQTPFMV